MNNNTFLWPIKNSQNQWDRLSMIPASYRDGSNLTFSDRGTGHLDLRDNHLVFQSLARSCRDFQLDLEQVTFFSLLWWTDRFGERVLLTVHLDHKGQREVHAFDLAVDRLHDFMVRLKRVKPDAPLAQYTDHGPQAARLYEQDIYGEWGRFMSNLAYIAPDRLLLAVGPDIRLDRITKLTLISSSTLPMLRIDYRLPNDPKLKHIGLRLFSHAGKAWANNLRQRTGAPLERIAERKKKPDDH